MKRIFDITTNDLRQLLRDRQTFLFLLLMPVAFTLLFGFAFGSFNKPQTNVDTRLIVNLINLDEGQFGKTLTDQLSQSTMIRIVENQSEDESMLTAKIKKDVIAAVVTIPEGYSTSIMNSQPLPVEILTKKNTGAAFTVEAEIKRLVNRTNQSAQSTLILINRIPNLKFDAVFETISNAWFNPPITLSNQITAMQQDNPNGMSAAQTAPGMMLQFSLAGLLTAGQMIVNERKSRAFHRLLTTATSRLHILLGHYFAILTLVFVQFVILILFGQFIMGLDYLNQALPTFLLTLACAMCIAAIGLLIGMLAKTDDQAIIFALIPMFIFSGLGGAWMPLEFTGKTFQTIGHFSPVAWGMDGFKSILSSGGGIDTIWLPVVVLFGYGVLFFCLAAYTLAKNNN